MDAAPQEALTFSFVPEPRDYSRTVRAFYTRQARTWIAVTLMGALMLAGVIYSAVAGTPLLGLSYSAIFLLVIAYLFVITPGLLARRVRRSARLRAETTWRVDDEGVAINSTHAEARMDWATFHRVIETAEHYLLVYEINKRMFQIVPKRALTAPGAEEAFRAYLIRHLNGLPIDD